MLLLSRWTIRQQVTEYGIQETTGYSNMPDEDLDTIVRASEPLGNGCWYSFLIHRLQFDVEVVAFW